MTITVLQWNVWYKEDIHLVVGYLRDHPADILCLQELTINAHGQTEAHTPSFVAAQLGMHSHFQEIPLIAGDGSTYTLVNGIFTKFPIAATHFTWINQPTGSGGTDDGYRAYVEVKLVLPDSSELSVGTTQCSFTNDFAMTPRRQTENQTLLQVVNRHTTRYILAADLNATPASELVDSMGLALTNAGPNLLDPTWTTKPFNAPGFMANTLSWRLDYIFTTPDIATKSAEILPTVYSDHLPIMAVLEV